MAKNLLELSGAELDKELQKIVSKITNKSKPWTTREEYVLRKTYVESGIPGPKVAKLLNRSVSSVYNHIQQKGLTRQH